MAYPYQFATLVKNISGGTRFFSYLGAHGATLEDDATYVEEGDLLAKLSGSRSPQKMALAALIGDLQNERAEIRRRPAPIGVDSGGDVKAIMVNAPTTVDAVALDYDGDDGQGA